MKPLLLFTAISIALIGSLEPKHAMDEEGVIITTIEKTSTTANPERATILIYGTISNSELNLYFSGIGDCDITIFNTNGDIIKEDHSIKTDSIVEYSAQLSYQHGYFTIMSDIYHIEGVF